MKKLLQVVFCLLIGLPIYSQTATINIKYHTACDILFDKPVTTKLYWHNGTDKQLVATKTSNPVSFDHLVNTYKYSIEVSSTDQSVSTPCLKEYCLIADHMLNITPLNNAGIRISDNDNSTGLSALDLTLLMNHIVKKENIQWNGWTFVNDAFLDLNSDYSQQFVIDGIPNNTANISIGAYQKMVPSTTLSQYCSTLCSEPRQDNILLKYERQVLKKGEEKVIPITLQNHGGYVASAFSLQYSNDVEVAVTNPNTIFKIDSVKRKLHLSHTGFVSYESDVVVANIKVKAINDIDLDDYFLSLSMQDNPQFIFKEGNCYVKYINPKIESKATYSECAIEWPEPLVTLPDCAFDYPTGTPKVVDSCDHKLGVFFTKKDTSLYNGTTCGKIIRTWTAIDYYNLKTHTFYQVIKHDSLYATQCKQNIKVEVGTGLKFLSAREIVLSPNPNHIYSFHKQNLDSITFFIDDLPKKETKNIYNQTDGTFCITSIEKVDCLSQGTVDVQSKISVQSLGNSYYVFAHKFIIKTHTNCNEVFSDFQIQYNNGEYKNNLNFPLPNFENKTVELNLRYKLNGEWIYHNGTVNVDFLKFGFDPLEINIYNDVLEKGKAIQIPLYSSNFNNMVGLQFGLVFRDAIIDHIEIKALGKQNTSYNLGADFLNLVWISDLTIGNEYTSINPLDTLLTITLIPNKNGTVTDFISLSEQHIISEAYFADTTSNEFISTKILLRLNFLNRQTSTLNDNPFSTLIVSPNPTSNLINVHSQTAIKQVQVFDLLGRIKITTDSSWIDLGSLESGYYILSVIDDFKNKHQIKVFKI